VQTFFGKTAAFFPAEKPDRVSITRFRNEIERFNAATILTHFPHMLTLISLNISAVSRLASLERSELVFLQRAVG